MERKADEQDSRIAVVLTSDEAFSIRQNLHQTEALINSILGIADTGNLDEQTLNLANIAHDKIEAAIKGISAGEGRGDEIRKQIEARQVAAPDFQAITAIEAQDEIGTDLETVRATLGVVIELHSGNPEYINEHTLLIEAEGKLRDVKDRIREVFKQRGCV